MNIQYYVNAHHGAGVNFLVDLLSDATATTYTLHNEYIADSSVYRNQVDDMLYYKCEQHSDLFNNLYANATFPTESIYLGYSHTRPWILVEKNKCSIDHYLEITHKDNEMWLPFLLCDIKNTYSAIDNRPTWHFVNMFGLYFDAVQRAGDVANRLRLIPATYESWYNALSPEIQSILSITSMRYMEHVVNAQLHELDVTTEFVQQDMADRFERLLGPLITLNRLEYFPTQVRDNINNSFNELVKHIHSVDYIDFFFRLQIPEFMQPFKEQVREYSQKNLELLTKYANASNQHNKEFILEHVNKWRVMLDEQI